MEWDNSGRKGRDGQKKKIGKANERKRKVENGEKMRKYSIWTRGERGALAPHGATNARCYITFLVEVMIMYT